MGTPSYMAPEQAQGKKDIGPAVDIYALGAILYECLTGRPPFRAATPLDTIMQVVNDEAVPPRKLNARVPVDLETVCVRCLQKEPGKRYSSAQALADDLARFRDGMSVMARPVGAVERGWRWCRRNPLVAASLLLVAASLLAASVVSVLFGLWAEQARQAAADRALSEMAAREEALQERDNAQKARQKAEEASETAKKQERIARTEAQKAREFSDLLLGVFESADPTGMQGYTFEFAQVGSSQLTAREILDRAVKEIRKQGHAELRTAQLTSIGNVYRSLGLYKQAGELLEQAHALRRQDRGTSPEEMADSLYFLGWLYHEQGQYPRARKYYQDALDIQRKRDADSPKVTATP
jgi:tetratricopeptide (TPR) repeat protein